MTLFFYVSQQLKKWKTFVVYFSERRRVWSELDHSSTKRKNYTRKNKTKRSYTQLDPRKQVIAF